MRIVTIACLLYLVTGCVAIQSGQQPIQNNPEPFHNALEQLLQNNNSEPLKAFIKEQPDSIFVNDAKQLLKLHINAGKYRSELRTCDKQLDSSQQELKKLQEDIDRLTQLNLEMDRSSP